MSADIVLRDASAPTDPDANLQLRYENTVNTPITSCTFLDDGRAVADEYELIFTVSGSATVQVVCSTKNPAYTASESCVCDGSTENKDVIPGLSLVFAAGTATGWKAKVSMGGLMNTSGVVTDRFNFGTIQSGVTTTQFRIAARNVGSDVATECKVTALPGSYHDDAGVWIEKIDNHSDDARDKMGIALLGDNTITFANWADGTGDDAGFKVADIMVDGNTAVTTARFDGVTVYQHGVAAYDDTNDYLVGFQIILALTTSDPSSASITFTVYEGYAWIEFDADVSGSPAGAWSNSDLTITESGETAGTITASNTAFFWARWAMPSAATIGAMRRVNLKGMGLTI